MEPLDYRVTDEFVKAYEAMNDETAFAVDSALARLLRDHRSAWERQGRVAGERGEAWILEFRTRQADVSLYWNYLDDRLILMVMLLAHPG